MNPHPPKPPETTVNVPRVKEKPSSVFKNTQAQYWDERYQSVPWAYGQEPNDFLLQEVESLGSLWGNFSGRRVLCLADGEGRNGVHLARLGFTVTCLDFSNHARAKALRWAEQCGVELDYPLVDLNGYEFEPQAWDLIVSIFFQPPAPTRERLYAGLSHALKDQGRFILEAKHDSTNAKSERYPGGLTLQQNIKPLQAVRVKDCVRTLNEGPFHQGSHQVTQLHAQKMA